MKSALGFKARVDLLFVARMQWIFQIQPKVWCDDIFMASMTAKPCSFTFQETIGPKLVPLWVEIFVLTIWAIGSWSDGFVMITISNGDTKEVRLLQNYDETGHRLLRHPARRSINSYWFIIVSWWLSMRKCRSELCVQWTNKKIVTDKNYETIYEPVRIDRSSGRVYTM